MRIGSRLGRRQRMRGAASVEYAVTAIYWIAMTIAVIEGRREAKLPLDTGQEGLVLMSRAAAFSCPLER